MSEPFALDFGLKSVEETQHDGQDGLLLTGYATRLVLILWVLGDIP